MIHFRSRKHACHPMLLYGTKRDDEGNLCLTLDGITVAMIGAKTGSLETHAVSAADQELLEAKEIKFFCGNIAVNWET